MAVVDDTVLDEKKTGFDELQTIDINDTSLVDGAAQEINPDADAWESATPPPDGTYKLKLFLSKQGFQKGKSDEGELYVVANLECKIQENEKWGKATVFGKVNTLISPGKEISTMAGLMKKMGVKLPPKMTPLECAKLLKKCLVKEPNLYCEGEWKAWDMPKSEWLKQGMKNFPQNPDKSYNHIVRDSKGGQVAAKWKPVRWYGLKEYKEMLEKEAERKKAVGVGKVNSGGGEVVMDSEVEQGGFTQVNPSQQAQKAAPDEDFVIDE